LATARAVPTRSADELAIPLPRQAAFDGEDAAGGRRRPGQDQLGEERALVLCAGLDPHARAVGSAWNVAIVQRATGSVTRNRRHGRQHPCSSSPNVPKQVLYAGAPR